MSHMVRWPERLDLAELFDPDTTREPLPLLCCANCQKSDAKLSACRGCHAVRYCGKACQVAQWGEHKAV